MRSQLFLKPLDNINTLWETNELTDQNTFFYSLRNLAVGATDEDPSEPTVYLDAKGKFNISDTYGCNRLELKYFDYQGLGTGYFLIGYRNTQSVILYQYLISCIDENEPLLTDTWKVPFDPTQYENVPIYIIDGYDSVEYQEGHKYNKIIDILA